MPVLKYRLFCVISFANIKNFAFLNVYQIADIHNPAKFWISLGNPIFFQQYSEQLVRIKGLGDIYPAFLLSKIFKAFFNGLFDGNHCCETADIKNFINVLS
jgi:hypothetical protein